MYKVGWIRQLSLRDTRKASLLVGLKVTSHLIAQQEIFSRSVLRQAAEVAGSKWIIKRLVSSANRRICKPISSTFSLI